MSVDAVACPLDKHNNSTIPQDLMRHLLSLFGVIWLIMHVLWVDVGIVTNHDIIIITGWSNWSSKMEVLFRSLPTLLLKVLNVYILVGELKYSYAYFHLFYRRVFGGSWQLHCSSSIVTVSTTTFETTCIESSTADNVMCTNAWTNQGAPTPTYTHNFSSCSTGHTGIQFGAGW